LCIWFLVAENSEGIEIIKKVKVKAISVTGREGP
jgi:hypothetical protein